MSDPNTQMLSAQVREDSALWEEFEEFSAGYESKSEAVRAAVREGLQPTTNRSQLVDLTGSLGWAFLALSLAGLALGSTTPAGVAAVLAAVLFVLSAVTRWRGGL
jgi:Arc/MetJ-type ribon-helix-helix transcriptional regulator